MSDKSYISVTELLLSLKSLLSDIPYFSRVKVRGEVSSLKTQYASAAYFNLKDGDSLVSATMWRNAYLSVPFPLKDGDEVIAEGALTVYPKRGQLTFNVYRLEKVGQGSLLLRLEELKRKLYAEGLFDERFKRPIPKFPTKIAIVVGKDSAAEADLLKNIKRRWPLADIAVFHSLVQGEKAPEDLKAKFLLADQSGASTLIMARGGGSIEDLWAFNDEELVRLAFKRKTPLIAAIGHEIDFSLLDYVSDKRVSTPTAAAEAATPDQREMEDYLVSLSERLFASTNKGLERHEARFLNLASRPFLVNPAAIYERGFERLDGLKKELEKGIGVIIDRKGMLIREALGRLEALNPLGTLSRGYTLTQDEKGHIITSVNELEKGKRIVTTFNDGFAVTEVIEKEKR